MVHNGLLRLCLCYPVVLRLDVRLLLNVLLLLNVRLLLLNVRLLLLNVLLLLSVRLRLCKRLGVRLRDRLWLHAGADGSNRLRRTAKRLDVLLGRFAVADRRARLRESSNNCACDRLSRTTYHFSRDRLRARSV